MFMKSGKAKAEFTVEESFRNGRTFVGEEVWVMKDIIMGRTNSKLVRGGDL